MIQKSTNFASYSKTLCWIVALISLLLAIITFVGDSPNAGVRGFLWLAVAAAFTVSALFLGRSRSQPETEPEAEARDSEPPRPPSGQD